jgi:hypothetical protein
MLIVVSHSLPSRGLIALLNNTIRYELRRRVTRASSHPQLSGVGLEGRELVQDPRGVTTTALSLRFMVGCN